MFLNIDLVEPIIKLRLNRTVLALHLIAWKRMLKKFIQQQLILDWKRVKERMTWFLFKLEPICTVVVLTISVVWVAGVSFVQTRPQDVMHILVPRDHTFLVSKTHQSLLAFKSCLFKLEQGLNKIQSSASDSKVLAVMGTFVGHVVPGLAFALLGLWHTSNTIKAYNLRGPSNFISRHWYPLSNTHFILKYLELIIIFFFSICVIALQVLDYPLFHFSFKPNNFEHATMFLHLAIYAGVAFSVELMRSHDMFSGLVGILASSVFGQELLLLHFHSADHDGLEGHYHWLMQLIVFMSLLSALVALGFPTSFPAALVRSMLILFQGCWFIDMGFALWVPACVPKGCYMRLVDDIHGAVTCGNKDASLRAMAIANLQFSSIFAGIMIFTAFVCLLPSGKFADRIMWTEYEKLHSSRSVDVGQVPVDVDGLKQINPSLV